MLRSIALAAIAAATLGIASPARADARSAPARPVCMEDRPCFRWDTMGDRNRGIYVYGRTARVIVGPCEYVALHSRINWSRTPRVRGDYSVWSHRGECDGY